MSTATHEFVPDPRNAGILVSVNGELVPHGAGTAGATRAP